MKKVKKVLMIGMGTLVIGAAVVLGYLRWTIQSALDEWCGIAQQSHPHPGDDVAALLEYVQTDTHSLRDRNLAVWSLGQARDNRALPILAQFYTGGKCDHNRYLCQGELAKAIALCKEGAPNILFIRTPNVSEQQ